MSMRKRDGSYDFIVSYRIHQTHRYINSGLYVYNTLTLCELLVSFDEVVLRATVNE
jgi:hypothetical protein